MCAVLVAPVSALAQTAPVIDDPNVAVNLIENMPAPAFQAALIDWIAQDGCVLDFADYAAEQRRIIEGMKVQLGILPTLAGNVNTAMDMRLQQEFDAMEGRFQADQKTRTVTLVDGCTE